ncbi:MAG: LLM class flavin-dependent oxidoreductase [Chloroflexi bacterium]|nr:MAG: LLM class flavin-dependent oxidoreductase [Chloroflexota bacterium]
MRVGVGLPTSTPGAGRDLVLEWARRADAGPFSSLGVIDRLVYECWEPLASLAACAAVTERTRLVTMVVIGPLRRTALLAKQAATVDALSGGRLVLGVGLGARHDDYQAAGIATRGRGDALTRQLVDLRRHWEGDAIGPRPVQPGGPALLVGGGGSAAFARAACHADGYVHGGGPPRAFASAAARARAAWVDAGRPGAPHLWGQAYFALGDQATADAGAAYLRDYYRFTGGFEERIAAGNLTTPAAIRDLVLGYEEEACDELVLLPTVSRLDQLERLADALA